MTLKLLLYDEIISVTVLGYQNIRYLLTRPVFPLKFCYEHANVSNGYINWTLNSISNLSTK